MAAPVMLGSVHLQPLGCAMAIEEFTRAFLAVYFTFVAVRYTAKILGQRARTGDTYIHDGAPGSRARLVRTTFNVFRVAIWAFCVVRVFAPRVDVAIGALPASPGLLLVGIACLMVAYAGVEYVHAYMDHDWRSGVPAEGQPDLLTEGPFALTRNPIFASVILGQIGLALALPSVFTLICLVAGATALMIQAGIEERRLAEVHGERYRAYAASVPRWLPNVSAVFGRSRRPARPSA